MAVHGVPNISNLAKGEGRAVAVYSADVSSPYPVGVAAARRHCFSACGRRNSGHVLSAASLEVLIDTACRVGMAKKRILVLTGYAPYSSEIASP